MNRKLLSALLICIALAGCGTHLGPGTLEKTDDMFEYRQDNNWVYSNGRSQIRASSMAHQHCDSLTIYESAGDFIEKVIGVNCRNLSSPSAVQTQPNAVSCVTMNSLGFHSEPGPCK